MTNTSPPTLDAVAWYAVGGWAAGGAVFGFIAGLLLCYGLFEVILSPGDRGSLGLIFYILAAGAVGAAVGFFCGIFIGRRVARARADALLYTVGFTGYLVVGGFLVLMVWLTTLR